MLLAAQMLGLAQGHNYFQQLAVSGLSYQGVPGAVHVPMHGSAGVLAASHEGHYTSAQCCHRKTNTFL